MHAFAFHFPKGGRGFAFLVYENGPFVKLRGRAGPRKAIICYICHMDSHGLHVRLVEDSAEDGDIAHNVLIINALPPPRKCHPAWGESGPRILPALLS